MRYTFKKSERLSSKTSIKELFVKGSSFYSYPFKVISLPVAADYCKILITVPKRLHKKAVTRNKIKRKIREAYRLNKHLLQTDNKLHIAYIYTSKQVESFQKVQKGVVSSLSQLQKYYSQSETK